MQAEYFYGWAGALGIRIPGQAQKFASENSANKYLSWKDHEDGILKSRQTLDGPSYATLLREYGNERSVARGKWGHAHVVTNGYWRNRYLGNILTEMYGKLGMVDDARQVFDRIARKNVFSWTLIISAYSQNRQVHQSLQLFRQMLLEQVKPDNFTLSAMVALCSNVGMLEEGREIHEFILNNKIEVDVAVENALLNMYGKCGQVEEAKGIFCRMDEKDVTSWNTIIAAYCQNERGKEALQTFKAMCIAGFRPNMFTFSAVLTACSGDAYLAEGKLLHAYICSDHLESEIVTANALINMYSKCGSMENAEDMFGRMPRVDIVSWTSLVSGFALNAYALEAVRMFELMPTKSNQVTWITMLDVCAKYDFLAKGKQIHVYVVVDALESNVTLGTALIHMYGKCRSVADAVDAFVHIGHRDMVAWSAMIAMYTHNNFAKEALQVFSEMQEEGMKPNKVSLLSVIDACASLAALDIARQIHLEVTSDMLEHDNCVGSSLVNMYGRCGCLESARTVFNKMVDWNLPLCSAMVKAYSQNGCARQAIELVYRMQHQGILLNEVIFSSIFSACSNASLVDESFNFLLLMASHSAEVEMEHYWCLFDLLRRVGWIDEREDMIYNLPSDDGAAWLWPMLTVDMCTNILKI